MDTSGQHKQDEALLEEIWQLAEVVSFDLIRLVMNACISQATYDHALVFKQNGLMGALIIIVMDATHAKGGGALSVVGATKSPILFLGMEEHMNVLEPFDAKIFISRLLGMIDLQGFVHKIVCDVLPTNNP